MGKDDIFRKDGRLIEVDIHDRKYSEIQLATFESALERKYLFGDSSATLEERIAKLEKKIIPKHEKKLKKLKAKRKAFARFDPKKDRFNASAFNPKEEDKYMRILKINKQTDMVTLNSSGVDPNKDLENDEVEEKDQKNIIGQHNAPKCNLILRGTKELEGKIYRIENELKQDQEDLKACKKQQEELKEKVKETKRL